MSPENRYSHIVLMLGLLFAVCTCSSAANMPSHFQGSALSARLEKYAGVTVELEPLITRCVQGQMIYVRTVFRMDPPRPVPWHVMDVLTNVYFYQNGVMTGHGGPSLSNWQPRGESVSIYEAVVQANGTNFSAGSRDAFGFQHLYPGEYAIVWDDGIISGTSFITIDPVPDSLHYYWNRYCEAQRIIYDPDRSVDRETINQIVPILNEFIALPSESMWRKEVLESGLSAFNMFRFRYEYSASDYIVMEQALIALADEQAYNAENIASHAMLTYCKRSSDAETAAALLEFVPRLNNPVITAKARSIAETLMARSSR